MDFGLFYYRQARLQNAADSAATAVAASIESTDEDMKKTALSYLKKNGMNYDEDKIQIKITKRGLLDEAAAADDYLTTGYLKLEVKVETGTIFGPLLHLDSLMLHSSSFVKVSADYTNRMPRALNYTLFAGSSNGTNADAAMQINGRTGTVTNILSSGLESFLNGVNENLIQPLIGFLEELRIILTLFILTFRKLLPMVIFIQIQLLTSACRLLMFRVLKTETCRKPRKIPTVNQSRLSTRTAHLNIRLMKTVITFTK